MTIDQFEYPALYDTASEMSASSQNLFLLLVRAEYVFLFLAAVSSLNFYSTPHYFIIPAAILIASLVVLIFRSLQKPEQDWYRGRALAESIKTSCWKYCMRAEPFGDSDSLSKRRGEFRSYLTEILIANRLIGDRLPPNSAAKDQITASMEATRALTLDERKEFYEKHRVRNQRTWYAKKASGNRKSSRRWLVLSIFAYAVAILISLIRITEPAFLYWPVEPIIVVASSILGWTQIKKFNELSSSYTLTAHEIGIIQGRVSEISSEEDFSMFVIEAEQAFSREHTQWVARQQQT
jgi:hypothetical protein